MDSKPRSGIRVRDVIDAKGLKIGWVIDQSGITRWRMSRLFQGAHMTLEEGIALSRVLGVPVETFAGEEREA